MMTSIMEIMSITMTISQILNWHMMSTTTALVILVAAMTVAT